MKTILLGPMILILLNAPTGSATELISNLAEPWTGPGIGDLRSAGPGVGFGISFSTGADWFKLDSVTLEQYLYTPANDSNFRVLLYQVDRDPGSSNPNLLLVGELGNPTVDPAITQWPGQTTWVMYSPTTPILLQPSSYYVVAGLTSPDAAAGPDLLFSLSAGFTGLPGWQLGDDYFGLAAGSDVAWFPAFQPGHLKFRVEGSIPPNRPPDISHAYPSVSVIWPPDGRLVPLQVLGVTDPDGDPVAITITAIEQDEPVLTRSEDKTAPDGIVANGDTAWIRAERLGSGNGRVYRVTFTATDGKPSGTVEGTVYVQVPHDRGGHSQAIDDGPAKGYYDSTASR